MRTSLWPTTIWIWRLANLPAGFDTELRHIPGEVGVLVKAADGRDGWSQWETRTVERFRQLGVGVGLWTFCYGRGPTRHDEVHTVADEVAALDWSLDRAPADLVVLNIEHQVMRSPDPALDVRQLVAGAKQRFDGVVGISTVWRWAKWARPWPFPAAVEGGVDFWTNQAYTEEWQQPGQTFDYVTEAHELAGLHGGGQLDVPSLWSADPASAASMVEHGGRAIRLGATGIVWWSGQHLNDDRWAGIRQVATQLAPAGGPDQVLERAQRADAARLGRPRFRALLRRRDWGGNVAPEYTALICERGVLIVVSGQAVDVTARAMDDFQTHNGNLLTPTAEVFPALAQAHQAAVARFGQRRRFARLHRADWGGHVAPDYAALLCERGMLIQVDDAVVDVTARAIDDFLTLNEQHGTLDPRR